PTRRATPRGVTCCRLPHPTTPHIHALSLHDALPIYREITREVSDALGKRRLLVPMPVPLIKLVAGASELDQRDGHRDQEPPLAEDRKSTRLNSSHVEISYAVFCLKKKRDSRGSTRGT